MLERLSCKMNQKQQLRVLLLYLFYQHFCMSSLKELTEDATTDRPDINHKTLAHLKSYTFFVYYQPIPNNNNHPYLQKLGIKIKGERSNSLQENKGGDSERHVQVQFYNLQSQSQRLQGLQDLKYVGHQSKCKIVAYCSEEGLLQLMQKASLLGINLSNIPVILIHSHPNSDFSSFCGWNEVEVNDFGRMPLLQLEQITKKWIQSAQQKVDMWTLSIHMKEDGRLQKLVGQNFETLEVGAFYEQQFVSHLSLGYHVRLSKNYNLKRKDPDQRRMNNLIYGWQRFKNFCCLGSSNMQTSTGVVNIHYIDEKGQKIQILKHLREYDGSQESQMEASRVIRSDKGILSLLIANIDRFHGDKIKTDINCKPGDGRLELVVFQGVKKCRKISTVAGQIVLRIQSESMVEMQVGQTIYRSWGCRQLRIRQSGRIRISINKDVLEC